jgi:hypothetical protein
VYVIAWPGLVKVAGLAVFVSDKPGCASSVIVAVACGEVTGWLPGSSPEAVAWLTTLPFVTSVDVVVYEPVHVVDAPAAKVVTKHVMPETLSSGQSERG